MKTLFRTYNEKQARAKQVEYENKYGVKFDAYHVGEGYRIIPVVTRYTSWNDEVAAASILNVLDKEYSFARLSDMTGLPIDRVLSGALRLVKTQRARFNVSRMGNMCSVKPLPGAKFDHSINEPALARKRLYYIPRRNK